MITNIIAAAIILLAVGASLRHIIKEKKNLLLQLIMYNFVPTKKGLCQYI